VFMETRFGNYEKAEQALKGFLKKQGYEGEDAFKAFAAFAKDFQGTTRTFMWGELLLGEAISAVATGAFVGAVLKPLQGLSKIYLVNKHLMDVSKLTTIERKIQKGLSGLSKLRRAKSLESAAGAGITVARISKLRNMGRFGRTVLKAKRAAGGWYGANILVRLKNFSALGTSGLVRQMVRGYFDFAAFTAIMYGADLAGECIGSWSVGGGFRPVSGEKTTLYNFVASVLKGARGGIYLGPMLGLVGRPAFGAATQKIGAGERCHPGCLDQRT